MVILQKLSYSRFQYSYTASKADRFLLIPSKLLRWSLEIKIFYERMLLRIAALKSLNEELAKWSTLFKAFELHLFCLLALDKC